jgi:rhamnogalacturonyl hydrolase YesR
MKFIFYLFMIYLPGSLVGQSIQGGPVTPYGNTRPHEVKVVLDRVLSYVDRETPYGLVNGKTGTVISDFKKPVADAALVKGTYGIYTHEWGLAYSGMLQVAATTGDALYRDYVEKRLNFLAIAAPYFRSYHKTYPTAGFALEHFLNPRILDDTGSMCAALIQAGRQGIGGELSNEIDLSIDFIMHRNHRLSDGTLARTNPFNNTVWVDDLYQGIPALAEMGKRSNDATYFDEACRQVILFTEKLFVPEKGVCIHGRVEGRETHPSFYWARANGWAILAIASLLDVLPANHSQREKILERYRNYCQGLVAVQSASGFWHQLLDRSDSFLETSATAMFTYALAHGINQGWLDVRSYGPPALLGWNAVSTKVNAEGQVEGTSAGTSLAFDAAFYYQRPVGTGPHGYGSVLLAGAAMYELLSKHPYDQRGPIIFRR